MMNKEKKKELAEMDSRWDFEKTVKTRYEDDWEAVMNTFNWIQENQGDLYMEVSKLENPGFIDRIKLKVRELRNDDFKEEVTFHHSQVYDWFEALAHHLGISVGKAVYLVEYETKELRKKLDLGDTMNVEINSIDDMAEPEESKVSKDELKEMVEND